MNIEELKTLLRKHPNVMPETAVVPNHVFKEILDSTLDRIRIELSNDLKLTVNNKNIRIKRSNDDKYHIMYPYIDHDFDFLNGLTVTSIDGLTKGSEEIIFKVKEFPNSIFKLYHHQECCEDVHLDDFEGAIEDILNTPIIQAEDVSDGVETEDGDSNWTFYRILTVKGHMTLKWHGSSNGYYSTNVDFAEVLI